MELTTAIQSEQHVKKELARRMGELQEQLHNVKEEVCHCCPLLVDIHVHARLPNRWMSQFMCCSCLFVSSWT